MRMLGFILLACLIITGLQALVTVLVVAAVALLAFNLAYRPRQTLAVLATLAMWSLMLSSPVVIVAVLVLGLALGWHRDQPP